MTGKAVIDAGEALRARDLRAVTSARAARLSSGRVAWRPSARNPAIVAPRGTDLPRRGGLVPGVIVSGLLLKARHVSEEGAARRREGPVHAERIEKRVPDLKLSARQRLVTTPMAPLAASPADATARRSPPPRGEAELLRRRRLARGVSVPLEGENEGDEGRGPTSHLALTGCPGPSGNAASPHRAQLEEKLEGREAQGCLGRGPSGLVDYLSRPRGDPRLRAQTRLCRRWQG